MAYADPQSVTINAVATSLPRIGTSAPGRLGTFRSADGNIVVDIKQDSTTNRLRHEVRLTQKKIAADPISSVNKEISTSVYMVVDEPRVGFTDAELGFLTASLIAWFTPANRDKLLGGES